MGLTVGMIDDGSADGSALGGPVGLSDGSMDGVDVVGS